MAEPTLGPLLFLVYILFMVMIVVNLFVALVTEAYETVHNALVESEKNSEIVDVYGYLYEQIKSLFRIGAQQQMLANEEMKFAYVAGMPICLHTRKR